MRLSLDGSRSIFHFFQRSFSWFTAFDRGQSFWNILIWVQFLCFWSKKLYVVTTKFLLLKQSFTVCIFYIICDSSFQNFQPIWPSHMMIGNFGSCTPKKQLRAPDWGWLHYYIYFKPTNKVNLLASCIWGYWEIFWTKCCYDYIISTRYIP